MNSNRSIVFFVVDDFQPLDLFGPLDAFGAARELAGADYGLEVAGLQRGPVMTESGIDVLARSRINEVTAPDTLVICGGHGARTGSFAAIDIDALRTAAEGARRVVSICTGAFMLARTGLADGRRIATHWRYARDLARRYPQASIDADSIFLRDGKLWSSAGVTAGLDLSLALIADDYGKPVAASVARQLVMYMHRTGNQAQYSEPLSAQLRADERFGALAQWISNNLSQPMTVSSLAERVALTPRHFTRLFRERFGESPARYIEKLRLDRARTLLCDKDARIETVAAAVGYASAAAFRRAFERRFAMAPSQFRARFDLPSRAEESS